MLMTSETRVWRVITTPWAGSITVADMQPKERKSVDLDGYKPKTDGGKGS